MSMIDRIKNAAFDFVVNMVTGPSIAGILAAPMGCATTNVGAYDSYISNVPGNVHRTRESKLLLRKSCHVSNDETVDQCLNELNEWQLETQDKMIDARCSYEDMGYTDTGAVSTFNVYCYGESRDAQSEGSAEQAGNVELRVVCAIDEPSCEDRINSFQLEYAQEKLVDPGCNSGEIDIFTPDSDADSTALGAICEGRARVQEKKVGE